MTAQVRVIDEHFGGRGREPAFTLSLASEQVTARELIARRVAEEVAIANFLATEPPEDGDCSRSFIIRLDPRVLAAIRDGASSSRPSDLDLLDEDEEVAAAVAAFEAGKFILLVDDRQVEDIDRAMTVMPDSEVVFLRLSPLVGG